MLQRTGSFKFRGAFNKLSAIPQAARTGGVVAFSSGNHAQGVAAAARILGVQATIVMSADAPVSKRERTKGYGADVVPYDRDRRIVKRLHARSPASAAPRWCRLMTIPKSLLGKAPWALRSQRTSARFRSHRISWSHPRPAAA